MNADGAIEPFVHETLVRPATDQDWPFITSSWLKSYRHSQFANHVPPAIYFNQHHAIIDRIMARGGTCTILAMQDNPDVVLGFICTEGHALHYLYIKLSFRRIHLGTRLLQSHDIQVVTHLTKAGSAFKASKLPQAVYNPYAI